MAKEKPVHLKLQHSESVVVSAAAQIYSAYVISGRVPEGDESKWMDIAIRDAIRMARATDDAVISDEEIDTLEGQAALDG